MFWTEPIVPDKVYINVIESNRPAQTVINEISWKSFLFGSYFQVHF